MWQNIFLPAFNAQISKELWLMHYHNYECNKSLVVKIISKTRFIEPEQNFTNSLGM
jgi:hypothetical protein